MATIAQYNFTAAVADFLKAIDLSRESTASEKAVKDALAFVESTRPEFFLVTHKSCRLAVKGLFDGKASLKAATRIAQVVALELDDLSDADKATRKAAKIENESVSLAPAKKDKSSVMKRAWEIAREAVKKFGGKVKDYFSASLKAAWAGA